MNLKSNNQGIQKIILKLWNITRYDSMSEIRPTNKSFRNHSTCMFPFEIRRINSTKQAKRNIKPVKPVKTLILTAHKC